MRIRSLSTIIVRVHRTYHSYSRCLYRTLTSEAESKSVEKNLLYGFGKEARPVINQLLHVQRSLSYSNATELVYEIPLGEYAKWRQVIRQPNLETSLDSMNVAELSAHSLRLMEAKPLKDAGHSIAMQKDTLPPTWVVVYLLSTKISTLPQSLLALSFVLKILPYTKEDYCADLLILLARAFSRYQVGTKLEILVSAFLELPLPLPPTQFNLILKALSTLRPTSESAKHIIRILNAMHNRQIKLDGRTYYAFLKNRFITLELTKILQAKMVQEGFKPSVEHLEAFLKIFGKHGVAQDAGRYLRAIRAFTVENRIIRPHGTEIKYYKTAKIRNLFAHTKWNNQYLRALLHDRSSAFKYLRDLTVLEETHIGTEETFVLPFIARVPGNSRRPLQSKRKSVDVYDWTTALYVASRDKSYDDQALLHLFQSGKKLYSATLASYTAIIRGFLKRKNYRIAASLWDELLSTKKRLDKKALTVGVDVLIGAGRPQEALEIVENLFRSKSFKEDVDIILINALSSSFLRINRPDIIFEIWDNLESIYGVRPNVESLTNLLRAAYAASKLDRSPLGILTNLGLYLPLAFRKGNKEEQSSIDGPAPTSADGFTVIKNMLNKKQVERASLWKGMPASLKAIDIFKQTILGNWPELQHSEPPANKVSSDIGASGPVWNMLQNVVSAPQRSSQSSQELTPRFPEITPDDKAFQAYISLLSTQGLSHEVLNALAWMRALEVKPTKKTLSLAIVLCSEITLRSPLLERFEGLSEYKKLMQWLKNWVGEDAMPHEKQIGRMLMHVSKEREST